MISLWQIVNLQNPQGGPGNVADSDRVDHCADSSHRTVLLVGWALVPTRSKTHRESVYSDRERRYNRGFQAFARITRPSPSHDVEWPQSPTRLVARRITGRCRHRD